MVLHHIVLTGHLSRLMWFYPHVEGWFVGCLNSICRLAVVCCKLQVIESTVVDVVNCPVDAAFQVNAAVSVHPNAVDFE